MKKLKHIKELTTVIISCFVFVFFFTQLVLSHQKTFSNEEMRVLQTAPKFGVNEIMSGTYQKDMASFLSDQFYERSKWVSAKTNLETKVGRNEFHDIYVGEEDYLFQKAIHPSTIKLKELSSACNTFANLYKDVTFHTLVIPDKVSVIPEKAPTILQNNQQKKDINVFYGMLNKRIKTMDTYGALTEEKDKQIYYRSDHHWTSDGAYAVFEEYRNTYLSSNHTDYKRYLVNANFYGTLANTSGYYAKEKDYVYMYAANKEVPVLVEYVEEKKKSTSLYALDKATSSNPYEVFMDGNHALVQIRTASSVDKRLLVIKDSYANSFIPFLAPYYNEITVVDPRYYYDNIHKLMKDRQISDVLFLYNANTLFEDSALTEVLRK